MWAGNALPLPSGLTATALCLRQWPASHPQPDRLRWIHRMLQIASSRGCRILPLALASRSGSTTVELGGHLFELTPWLPGSADYHDHPSDGRLCAALGALAQFHRACILPQDGTALSQAGSRAEPISLEAKWHLLNHYLQSGAAGIEAAVRQSRESGPVPRDDGQFLLQQFHRCAPQLARRMMPIVAQVRDLPLQPCLRDIWHDHVLFCGEQVTGLVDFGAMRIDSVSTDVARLLGSLVRHDQVAWQRGLTAYQALRPLSWRELRAASVSHLATLLLSGMNWLQWLLVENRTFEAGDAVRQRVARCREDVAQFESWMEFFRELEVG